MITRKNEENERGVSFNSVADSHEIGGQRKSCQFFVNWRSLQRHDVGEIIIFHPDYRHAGLNSEKILRYRMKKVRGYASRHIWKNCADSFALKYLANSKTKGIFL